MYHPLTGMALNTFVKSVNQTSKFYKSNIKGHHLRLKFYKTQNKKGFVKKAKLSFEKFTPQKRRGLFNKVYHFRDDITGDVPSITAALNTKAPKTAAGRIALTATKGTYKFTRTAVKTVFRSAVFVEDKLFFAADLINPNKKAKLNFTRTQNLNGKYKTRANIVFTKRSEEVKRRGLFNKVYYFRDGLSGDIPSITAALNTSAPKTAAGRIALTATKGTYKYTRTAVKTVFKSAVFVEDKLFFAADIINPNRQAKLKFTRTQKANGKYKTRVEIVFKDRSRHSRGRGVIHNAVEFINNPEGDVPSLTKALNSANPKSFGGKAALGAAKGTYAFVKSSKKAVETTALSSESAVIFAKEQAKNKFQNKLNETTSDDTGKALLKTSSVVYNTFSRVDKYREEKKEYKQEKQNLKEVKAEHKALADSYSKLLEQEEQKFKAKESKFKAQKQAFKKSDRSYAAKYRFKQRKKEFKAEKKKYRKATNEILSASSTLLTRAVYTPNAFYTTIATAKVFKRSTTEKIIRNQKRLTKLKKPEFNIGVTDAYWNKLQSNVSENNDTAKVITTAVNTTSSLMRKNKAHEIERAEKQKSRLEKKSSEQQAYIKSKYSKTSPTNYRSSTSSNANVTKRKPHFRWQRWRKKYGYDELKTVDENIKIMVKNVFKRVGSVSAGIAAKAVLFLIPIAAFLICVNLVIMGVASIFQQSGFILGTYTARDGELTDCVYEYTRIAMTFNQNVIDCGDPNKWKDGLYNLHYIEKKSDLKTTPTKFEYSGDKFSVTPGGYDYDPYVLWSFMCAFYYDFDKAAKAKEKGKSFTPDYWTLDSSGEQKLQELFDAEYVFHADYNNESHWEDLPSRLAYPDKQGYYFTVYSEFYSDRIRLYQAPTEIWRFAKDGWVGFNADTLEILDANNSNAQTGYFLMDQRWNYYNIGNVDGGVVRPFYYHDEYGDYYWGDGNPRQGFGWAGGDQIYFCVSPGDTFEFAGGDENLSDKCLVTYLKEKQWVTDVTLSYVVEQKCTFIEACETLLGSQDDYGEDRLSYFRLLYGDELSQKGNHQFIKCPIKDKTIKNLLEENQVCHNYGFDVNEWNKDHCLLKTQCHSGIDIICSESDSIVCPIDGTVKEIISGDNNTIVIENSGINFWYDDQQKGKKHAVKITINNIQNISVVVGETITKGTVIGTANDDRYCYSLKNRVAGCTFIHLSVQIKYSKYEFIDPKLLIE